MHVAEEIPTARRPRLVLRLTRPSMLDPGLRGDPWIDRCYLANCLVVHLNNQPVALLAGTSLEYASFNQTLSRMRCRYPRQSKSRVVA